MGTILSVLVTQNKVKIAQLMRESKEVVVHRFLTGELPAEMVREGCIRDTEGFAEVLKRMLKNAGIRAKKVIFLLPPERIMTKEAVFPDMSQEKIKAVLNVNASDYFPIDLTEYVLSYFPITKVSDHESDTSKGFGLRKEKQSKKIKLMVMAAPNEMVQSYYDAAKSARLQVVSVEYPGNSALQLASRQISEKVCLVLQINSEDTVMTLFRNKKMLLQRYIDVGSSLLSADLETDKRVKFYELADRMQRTMEYYTGVRAAVELEEIYLLGEQAVVSVMAEVLEQRPGGPVKVIPDLRDIRIRDRLNLITKDEVLANLDLISTVFAPRGFLSKKLEQDLRHCAEARVCRIMVLAALLIAAVNITIPATEYFQTAIDTMEYENRLILSQDMHPVLDEYRQAKSRYEDAQSVWSYIESDSKGITEFISYLEQFRSGSTLITSLSYDKGKINISVMTYGKRAATKLIQQLNDAEHVSDVRASSLSSSFDGENEIVMFTLSCKVAEKGEK